MKLTAGQRQALFLLSRSRLKKKFYWTGGTLLAYRYLKHRRSLDLDFFSDERFSYDEVNVFVEKLKKKGGFSSVRFQKIFDRYEFILEDVEVLRIEFVHYNKDRKILGKRRTLLGVTIDSLEDIAANKVMAYFDRNEPKDLFDIYFLQTKANFTAMRLLDLVHEKFGVRFGESGFWSEAFKGLPLLRSLEPLMLESEASQKKKILKKIEEYFQVGSKRFLDSELKQ